MKNKITILLPDLTGGGAEKNFLIMSNYWIKNNFDVELVLLKKKGIFLKYLSKNIQIVDLNVTRMRYSFFKLLKYFYSTKNREIFVSLWPLTGLAILANLFSFNKMKVILFEHQFLSITNNNNLDKISFFSKLFINITYYFAHHLICVSNYVKFDIQKLLFFKKKINVLYNPSYIEENNILISKNKIDEMWGSNKPLKILSVGSLKKIKDHETLINSIHIAIKISKIDVKLIIFGEGVLEKRLKHLIRKLKLEKNIYIKKFQYDLRIWYLSCDLFILSSIYEGFANVIVEAMSFKKKIISTKCGGPEEILENGKYGKLVEPQNPEMMAHNIINHKKILLNNNLVERAKYFSKQKFSNQLMKILK